MFFNLFLLFSLPHFRMCGIYMIVQSMKPTLWRTCRIIANDSRLNLLQLLFKLGENSVTALGKQAGLSESHASLHLRLLNSRGLISARIAGKWVYYSATANQAVRHAPEILDALKTSYAYTDIDNNQTFNVATAFTHQRRIMIAKHLHHGAISSVELSFRTMVPLTSLRRHLKKLEARHFIKTENNLYTLGNPSHPLAQTLLSIAAS